MTRKEFKQLADQVNLFFSSLFARKMTKALFNVQPDAIYFTNLTYKYDRQKGKQIDDFYRYRPQPDHAFHSVKFRTDQAFAELRALLEPIYALDQPVMIVCAELCRAMKAAYSSSIPGPDTTDPENITIDAVIKQQGYGEIVVVTTVTIPESDACVETTELGLLFDRPRTETIDTLLVGSENKTVGLDPIPIPLAGSVKGDLFPLDVPGSRRRFMLLDGFTHVSTREYGKKSKLPYQLNALSYNDNQTTWRMCSAFQDDDISVLSVCPGALFFDGIANEEQENGQLSIEELFTKWSRIVDEAQQEYQDEDEDEE